MEEEKYVNYPNKKSSQFCPENVYINNAIQSLSEMTTSHFPSIEIFVRIPFAIKRDENYTQNLRDEKNLKKNLFKDEHFSEWITCVREYFTKWINHLYENYLSFTKKQILTSDMKVILFSVEIMVENLNLENAYIQLEVQKNYSIILGNKYRITIYNLNFYVAPLFEYLNYCWKSKSPVYLKIDPQLSQKDHGTIILKIQPDLSKDQLLIWKEFQSQLKLFNFQDFDNICKHIFKNQPVSVFVCPERLKYFNKAHQLYEKLFREKHCEIRIKNENLSNKSSVTCENQNSQQPVLQESNSLSIQQKEEKENKEITEKRRENYYNRDDGKRKYIIFSSRFENNVLKDYRKPKYRVKKESLREIKILYEKCFKWITEKIEQEKIYCSKHFSQRIEQYVGLKSFEKEKKDKIMKVFENEQDSYLDIQNKGEISKINQFLKENKWKLKDVTFNETWEILTISCLIIEFYPNIDITIVINVPDGRAITFYTTKTTKKKRNKKNENFENKIDQQDKIILIDKQDWMKYFSIL